MTKEEFEQWLKSNESRKSSREEGASVPYGLIGTVLGVGLKRGADQIGKRSLTATDEDAENTRKLLVKMYGEDVGNSIFNVPVGYTDSWYHPVDDGVLAFSKDHEVVDELGKRIDAGPFYADLDPDLVSDALAVDNKKPTGLINRASTHDSPEAFLHELGHSTKGGRAPKLLNLDRKYKSAIRRIEKYAPLTVIGSSAAANVLDRLREDSTEDSRDDATIRAAIASGALSSLVSVPKLYEEARANIQAMRIAKKFKENIRKRKLLASFGTYASLPLGMSILPATGVVLGARARKKKREEEKRRLEKKSSLLPFYARLAESQS